MKKICLLLLLSITLLHSQDKKDVIATVGNEKISTLDYKSRFELMPRITEYKEEDSLKKEFLFSMIGEKLWALEALNKGLDTTDYFRSVFEPLKKMYYKDALFQEEIAGKINISPDEIARGIFRSRVTNQAYIFAFRDSSEAVHLNSLIKKNVKLDSLLVISNLSKENISKISYGDLDDPDLETALYKLQPGQYTPPVKAKKGWFIFYLADRSATTDKSDDEIQRNVKEILKQKKARELGMPYLQKLFSKIKSDVNKDLFDRMASMIFNYISTKTPDSYEKQQGFIFLDENTVSSFMHTLGDSLSLTFFIFNNTPVTLKKFLFSLNFEAMRFKQRTQPEVNTLLKRRIDNYIEQEILSAEAIKRGLDKKESVIKDLNNWRDSYLSQLLRNRFSDGAEVKDDEVYQYYLQRLNKIDTVAQVNILEILTDKLETVELVLNEINKGTDFRELAKQYTIRAWTKEKGGEFGLFPVTKYKQLSSVAVNMKLNEVFGPIKTDEGYSIIKLIEKKDAVRSFSGAYDNVKDELKNELVGNKMKDAYEEETVKLSYKYGATVNWKALKEVKLNDIPMFTYRYMGFGGRIAAVPYTTPWYNWVKKAQIIF